jgi:hypothetical protein
MVQQTTRIIKKKKKIKIGSRIFWTIRSSTGPFEIIRIKNPNSVIQCQITGKTQEVHNNRLKSIG